MKTPLLRSLVSSALLLFTLVSLPAGLHAQLPKIFVASFGNDANDGSRNAPKRNFQAAHDAVATGGEIVALDTAGYGKLSITKSVDITVPPGVNGFVTVSGNLDGVTIATGAGGVVSLRGLIVEGGGTAGSSSGILATSVGTLTVEDCTVRNFSEGIYVNSNTAAQVSLFNTAVRNCAYGLDMENNGAITVVASATGCRVEKCSTAGVLALTNGSGGAVDFSLDGCTVRGNNEGVDATNPSAVLRASNCTITGNTTGVVASNGGQALSRANNTLEKNSQGTTFPGAYSAR